MKQNKTLYLLMAIIVLLFAGAMALFVSNYKKKSIIEDITAQFELEKEALEDDYSQLALQYEDYGIRLQNDSLAELLDMERTKNLRLIEEIRTLKVNNARRLSELRKELEAARSVMRSYVVQIDSLNSLNTRLQEENKLVTQRYREARNTMTQLQEEKEKLTEKVMLAQKLEARDIRVRTLNERGRVVNRINRMTLLEFQAVLSKNISTEVGEKNIYLRILQPDNTPLLKANATSFDFEGSQLECSVFRSIEYDGEEQAITLYWPIEEFLHPGDYRADFFADGYLIGSMFFQLNN